ncbi:MAG: DUF1653 domain-containing protein [Hungatella sp.]|nr:DUF1653 domain-containing protein [Hungatella sp.]
MDRTPRSGEIYRHFKNKLYQVLAVAQHTETGEKLVVYQALYGAYRIYARPFSMFVGEVDKKKYPQIEQQYRFEKVDAETLDNESDNLKSKAADIDKPEAVTSQEPKDKHKSEPNMNQPSEARDDQELESETEEVKSLNPLLLPFVEAEDFQVKLEILAAMEGKVGEEDLDILYEALDLPKMTGNIEEQIHSIKQYIEMRKKFDGKRLR